MKTVFLVSTQNTGTGTMWKWPARASTVEANVGRELSLLKMAINMANADYLSFFMEPTGAPLPTAGSGVPAVNKDINRHKLGHIFGTVCAHHFSFIACGTSWHWPLWVQLEFAGSRCSLWMTSSGQLGWLTQWGRHKIDAISQTSFSNVFSSMKMCEFRFKSHWSVFLRVQLTIIQHRFRQWLGADQATSHYLNQWWLDYRRIYASLGLNELKLADSQINIVDSIDGWVQDCSYCTFALKSTCRSLYLALFSLKA